MSLDRAIARFRRRQEDLFRSECRITRASTTPSFNPTTGVLTAPTTTVYSGPCLIRPAARQGNEGQSGERELRVLDFVAKLPVDTDVAVADVLTVTAAMYDSALVDKEFRVTDVLVDDWQIARVAMLEAAS